jgi:hypothetical protein
MKPGRRFKNIFKMNKKIIGYILFGLSFIMWLVPAYIGFFNLSAKQVAIIITVAIVAGEVFFVLSILILGKQFWNKIKRILKLYWYRFLRVLKPKLETN